MASRARLGERAAVAATARRDRAGAPRFRLLARAAAHEHWVAAAAFALLALVYLWPALVQGHPLLPSAGLYQLAPWRGYAPADLTAYFNPALVDVPTSYYPWWTLARHDLHAGAFPAWNPYALAGTPFLGNPEVAWLSPFTWALLVLPSLNWALGFVAAVKLWLAGFGTYLLARELRLSHWPALVAGLSFALCTFDVVWLSYGVHVAVAVMLPWALWLVERIVRRGGARDGLALVLVVALVATGGHPGTQLHVLVGVVLYALMRIALAGDLARTDRLRRLGLVGAALALGTLLAAATLLPAQQAAIDTAGAAARRDGSAGFAGSHLSLGALRAALFPDWWGRPSEDVYVEGPANYSERALFAGTIPLILAVAALVVRDGWRRKAPFVVLGAIGLAVGLRAPLIRDAVVNAPLFDQVQNQRILLWFLLAVAVLSAFGLQALLDGRPGRRRAWGALAAALACAAVALATVRTAPGALGDATHYLLHRSGAVVDGVLPLASVGWMAIFALALAVLLLAVARVPERRRALGAAAALLVALEMLHFAHGFQTMGPAAREIPPRTPAVAFLQRHRDEGRIAAGGYALSPDWTTVYRLRDARGYDAPQPSLRFHRLWRTMSPRQTGHNVYAFASLGPEATRVLSLLGTRYVLLDPGAPSFPGWRTVYDAGDATIVANDAALPRALVARRVHVAGGLGDEVASVTEPALDPRREVVVRRDELPRSFDATQRGGGDVRVVDEHDSRVTLRAHLQRPSVVLLDDAWAPGWSVRVDGRSAQALQTDVVLRGVAVPAGTHEIVWSYRVPGLRAGAALSLLALLATLAWAGWLVVRARRRVAPG
ncbi:MAG: hypothetical protein ACTHOE_14335 [Conexibacter sp.]